MSWFTSVTTALQGAFHLHSNRGKPEHPRARIGLEPLEAREVLSGVSFQDSTFSGWQFRENFQDLFDGHVVGYALAVNHENKLKGLASAGERRTAADAPADIFTIGTKSEIGSVSKTITATALLKILQDQTSNLAQLNARLSDPIQNYLPPDWQIGPNVHKITLRHLLTHRSGFRSTHDTYDQMKALIANGVSDPETIGKWVPWQNAWAEDIYPLEPNTDVYSNANFTLMRVIIPYLWQGYPNSIINISPVGFTPYVYKLYVQQHLLGPMGINADTAVTGWNNAIGYNFFQAQTQPGILQADATQIVGAGGWKMSALELAAFVRNLRHNDAILAPATRDLMNDQQLGWYAVDPSQDTFGTTYTHNGGLGYTLNGRSGSFSALMMAFPGDVEAALVWNSGRDSPPDYWPGGDWGWQDDDILYQSYLNAWTDLTIEGTLGNDTLWIKKNYTSHPALPTAVDIVLNGKLVATRWAHTLDSLTFHGLAGDDKVWIDQLPSSTHVTFNGGQNNDTVYFGANDVDSKTPGRLTFQGGSGSDRLVYQDADDALNDSYTIGTGFLLKGISTGIAYFSPDVEQVELVANKWHNHIEVVDALPFGVKLSINANLGNDTISVLTSATDQDWAGQLVVQGGNGTDHLTVDDRSNHYLLAHNHRYQVTDQSLRRWTKHPYFWIPVSVSLAYGSIEDLTLYTGNQTDLIDVTATSVTTKIFSEAGNDHLTVGNAANKLDDITAPLTLNTGDGTDTITLNDHGQITGQSYTITNSLVDRDPGMVIHHSIAGVTEHVQLNTGSGNDQLHVSSNAIGNTTSLHGGDGSDTLTGTLFANEFSVTGTDQGYLNGVNAFDSVENLVGGDADDWFYFHPGSQLTGSLTGKGGVNSLSYPEWTTGVVVNLPLGTATAIGAQVSGIRDVYGSTADDILVGDSSDNQLFGQHGRDLIIGGEGADFLVGGRGDDILIAGFTDFDEDPTALTAIRLEWTQPNAEYKERIVHLTQGGGFNGNIVLTSESVQRDQSSDTLQGDKDADWFLTSPKGSLPDVLIDLGPDEVLTE